MPSLRQGIGFLNGFKEKYLYGGKQASTHFSQDGEVIGVGLWIYWGFSGREE